MRDELGRYAVAPTNNIKESVAAFPFHARWRVCVPRFNTCETLQRHFSPVSRVEEERSFHLALISILRFFRLPRFPCPWPLRVRHSLDLPVPVSCPTTAMDKSLNKDMSWTPEIESFSGPGQWTARTS